MHVGWKNPKQGTKNREGENRVSRQPSFKELLCGIKKEGKEKKQGKGRRETGCETQVVGMGSPDSAFPLPDPPPTSGSAVQGKELSTPRFSGQPSKEWLLGIGKKANLLVWYHVSGSSGMRCVCDERHNNGGVEPAVQAERRKGNAQGESTAVLFTHGRGK